MTLREALDLLELNERTLEQSMLDVALQNRLEHTELRHVMRVFEAYRKVNAFLNPTLNSQGDARVTIIDESIPGELPIEVAQVASPPQRTAPVAAPAPITETGSDAVQVVKDPFVSDEADVFDTGLFDPVEERQTIVARRATQVSSLPVISRAPVPLTPQNAVLLIALGALAFAAGVFVLGPLVGRAMAPRNDLGLSPNPPAPPAVVAPPSVTRPQPVAPQVSPAPRPAPTPPVVAAPTPPVAVAPATPPAAPRPAPVASPSPSAPVTPRVRPASPQAAPRPSVAATPRPPATVTPRAARAVPRPTPAPRVSPRVAPRTTTAPRSATAPRATTTSRRVTAARRSAAPVQTVTLASRRSLNAAQFQRWDRSGAVLRYRSWALVPDAVRALNASQFRAAVYVASSPQFMPDLPRP